jgi:hypothetical protein
MLIAFPLLSLFFLLITYAGIRVQHSPPQPRAPWESVHERHPMTLERRLDPDVGYDEKLHADFEESGRWMTRGGWLRAIVFLLLAAAVVWLAFTRTEYAWYLRLPLSLPCGGAAAMSLYNLLRRK